MKDTEHYDLAGTHVTQTLLEVFLLSELEKTVCHSFRYASAQSHIVGICLMAIIVFFQALLLFCGALCSIAYGLALIVWLFGAIRSIACGSGCIAWLYGIVTSAFGVLCNITSACRVPCSMTSSIASTS